ncbi:MAG: sacA [Microbacterium sp.]|nr:sacA [Microbacterium sp.]
MAFSLDEHWVWDFWVADDGDVFHLFYLHAPKALGDPELRHRFARIGHATSADLHHWTDHGEVLGPGTEGSHDQTATWTGSVVQGNDGVWRMFYTGASFESDDNHRNIETICLATSPDLFVWTKDASFSLSADARYYEKLGESDWPEEAWRDPWVYPDPSGHGWHMLITARGKSSGLRSGGVIGHAWSEDLETWSVLPPLGPASETFAHLEVPQIAEIGGRSVLVFCAPRTTADDDGAMQTSGVWAVATPGPPAPVWVDDAELLAPAPYYAGRIVQDRSGTAVLLAFIGSSGSSFEGTISDPIAPEAVMR